MTQKLKVRSSHLLLRFYPDDGWTRDLLESVVEDVSAVTWSGFRDYSSPDERVSEEGGCGYWVVTTKYPDRSISNKIKLEKLEEIVESVVTYMGEDVPSGTERFRSYVQQFNG